MTPMKRVSGGIETTLGVWGAGSDRRAGKNGGRPMTQARRQPGAGIKTTLGVCKGRGTTDDRQLKMQGGKWLEYNDPTRGSETWQVLDPTTARKTKRNGGYHNMKDRTKQNETEVITTEGKQLRTN